MTETGGELKRAFARAIVSGSAASVTSAVALAVCSKIEQDSAAAALNGPSQWVWGEAEAYTREATVKHTLTGYVIHHAMSIVWATVHERVFCANVADKSVPRCCLDAATTASAAYIADYYIAPVAPRRLRPGFKKHLGPTSIFAVYAAFGAGLAAAAIVRKAMSSGGASEAPASAGAQSAALQPAARASHPVRPS